MSIEGQICIFINQLTGTSAFADAAMVGLSRYYPHLLIGISLIGILQGRSHTTRILFLGALVAAVIGYAFNMPLRYLLFRPRPFVRYDLEPLITYSAERSSFPSNHTAASAAFGFYLLLHDRVKGLLFTLGAVLVGFSRIYVGVHYPTDILFGLVVGLLAARVVSELILKYSPNLATEEK